MAFIFGVSYLQKYVLARYLSVAALRLFLAAESCFLLLDYQLEMNCVLEEVD